jgi:single-strand DNA-binding protein
MAKSFNKVIMIGNISTDPEVRQTTVGKKVVRFRIAINDDYRDTKRTYFFTVVAWDRLGEIVQSYAEKGSRIMVEGRLVQREWETLQDGKNVKKSAIEIVAENIVLLGTRGREVTEIQKGEAMGAVPVDEEKLDSKRVSYSDILSSSSPKGESKEEEGEFFEEDEDLSDIDEYSDLDDYEDFDEEDREFK